MGQLRVLPALFLIQFTFLTAQERPPARTICTVCALRGDTRLKKVKARSEYEGKTYYFNSKNCKKEFESDPVAYLPPQLPRPAPAFVVETLEGKKVALQDFENRVVLLDFWATWCKPCRDMMPGLQELHETYSGKGLVVLGISIDEGKNRVKKVQKFLQKVEVSYPILVDSKNALAWQSYKVKVVPATFLIDRNGSIVQQWMGMVDHEKVRTAVTKLLASEDN
ncbi:MAG: redoxin domain-containing protein [Candidatus Binatia bacterium]